ncbi:MAG: MATE family efflux transporter [Oscillospiraceae bacterium]|nr:MATE family efflux transporter [Oscillospiraceae bacterium]
MATQARALENNLSVGSVPKRLISFALPFLLSNIIQSLYNVADMLIVGNFSGELSVYAMSGVNIGGQITFVLTNLTIGLCTGATVLISQFIGKDDRTSLKNVTSTIITMLLAFAAVVTVVTLFTIDPILHLVKTPAESYEQTRAYLKVTLFGIVFIFGYNAFAAILRGMGDSKHPLWFVAAAGSMNIILDYVLVKSLGMAAYGAALATVISQAVSMILCIIFMKRNNFQFDFKVKSFKIDKEQFRLILKIGLPSMIQNGVVSMSFMFLTSIVNTVGGVAASAAHGAVGKFNSFVFMPTAAISGAVSTMSAQNIGAGRMDRAVQSAKIGALMSMVISYTFFTLVMIFPDAVIKIFNRDAETVAAGVAYIRAFSYDLLLIPIIFNINGFLLAGGHAMFSMAVGLTSSVILRIPASYLLAVSSGLGMRGVGFGAPIASAGALTIILCYLATGRWKKNVVGDNIIIPE